MERLFVEQGIHTYDIYTEGSSSEKVGTSEFADAVISNLGELPSVLKPVNYANGAALILPKYIKKEPKQKILVGVDLFLHWNETYPKKLAEIVQKLNNSEAQLSMITNRGIKVWPDGFEETFCTDHWRCRFKPSYGTTIIKKDILELLMKAEALQLDVIKTENLYNFDGLPGFSLGQGQ